MQAVTGGLAVDLGRAVLPRKAGPAAWRVRFGGARGDSVAGWRPPLVAVARLLAARAQAWAAAGGFFPCRVTHLLPFTFLACCIRGCTLVLHIRSIPIIACS